MINKIKPISLTSTRWSWNCVKAIEPYGDKTRLKVFMPGMLGESEDASSSLLRGRDFGRERKSLKFKEGFMEDIVLELNSKL